MLSNDIATALKVLAEEEGADGEYQQGISLAFAASERYFKLRRQLGIAVDQN